MNITKIFLKQIIFSYTSFLLLMVLLFGRIKTSLKSNLISLSMRGILIFSIGLSNQNKKILNVQLKKQRKKLNYNFIIKKHDHFYFRICVSFKYTWTKFEIIVLYLQYTHAHFQFNFMNFLYSFFLI